MLYESSTNKTCRLNESYQLIQFEESHKKMKNQNVI